MNMRVRALILVLSIIVFLGSTAGIHQVASTEVIDRYFLTYEKIGSGVYVVWFKPYYVYHGRALDIYVYLSKGEGPLDSYLNLLRYLASTDENASGCAKPDMFWKYECMKKVYELRQKLSSRIPTEYHSLVEELSLSKHKRVIDIAPYMTFRVNVYESEYKEYGDELVEFCKTMIARLSDYNVTRATIVVYPDFVRIYDIIYHEYGKEYYDPWIRLLMRLNTSRHLRETLNRYGVEGLESAGIGEFYAPTIWFIWGNFSKRGLPSTDVLDALGESIESGIVNASEFKEFLPMFTETTRILKINITKPVVVVILKELRMELVPLGKKITPTLTVPRSSVSPTTNTISTIEKQTTTIYEEKTYRIPWHYIVPGIAVIAIVSIAIAFIFHHYIRR